MACKLDGCLRPKEPNRKYCPMHQPWPGDPNYRSPRQTYLPTEALVTIVEGSHRPVSTVLPASERRMYYRAKQKGTINLEVAERILEHYGRGIPDTYGGYYG
jgi:hypothetical protein